MFEIAGIDHVVLRTSKLKEMLDFYSKALVCKVERESPPEIGITQLRASSSLIDLVRVDSKIGKLGGGPSSKTENNMDHFCLQLKMISEEDIRSHLETNNIEVGEFPSRYGAQGSGKSIYIKDPEGNTVELRSQVL